MEHGRKFEKSKIIISEASQYRCKLFSATILIICYILIKSIKLSTHNPHVKYLRKHHKQLNRLSEEIGKKNVMILNSDAIVYPGAMVIVSLDTPPTYNTMPTAASPNNLAFRTKALGVKGFE